MRFLFIALMAAASFTGFSATSQAGTSVQAEEQIIGIGIALSAEADGTILIQNFIENAPAMKSGLLHVGDELIAVDSAGAATNWVAVTGMKLEDVVALIRGESGTQVSLQLRHENMDYQVTLTREPIVVN